VKEGAERHKYIPAFGVEALTPLFEPLLRIVIPYRVRTAPLLAAIAGRTERPRTLLDLGCGGGLLLQEIGSVADNLIGLEIDPRGLEIASGKRIPNLRLIRASACAIPLGNRTVDLAVSRLVFHHLTRREKEEALKEIHRVLNIGGLFVLADFGKPQDPFSLILSLSMRISDRDDRTLDNLKGRLPRLLRESGLTGIREVSVSRTLFGTFQVFTAMKSQEER
jgi:SAM-dependent methyltransferase